MEFLSPKTKERLSKLEQENAQLRAAVEAKQVKSNKIAVLIPWLFTVIASTITVFLFLRPAGPSNEEISRMRVEMWRNGNMIDTSFTPDAGLIFSIQVGAFKNLDIKELSHGLADLMITQDTTYTRIKLGQFASLPEAQEFLEVVINIGFEQAFIVAYEGDNAVGLLSKTTALN
jgi:hypothetical protein